MRWTEIDYEEKGQTDRGREKGREARCKVTSRSECVFQAVRQAVCVWRSQIERKGGVEDEM